MSQVPFSSLQFKFGQCYTQVMKPIKMAKHKKMLNKFCIVYVFNIPFSFDVYSLLSETGRIRGIPEVT